MKTHRAVDLPVTVAWRRGFGRWLAGVAALMVSLTFAVATVAATNEVARPNIVFIMTDDHAWQAISAYHEARHLIDTTNIDRLANEGMRFDRKMIPKRLANNPRHRHQRSNTSRL